MSIFRAYDVRGLYPNELDERMMGRIGKAFATYTRYDTVAVGCDVRLSSPALKDALIKGLVSCGVTVFDVGMVTTPMLYYARAFLECEGAMMVTASHNPPEYNGVKMCKGGFAMSPDEIQVIPRLISEGVYRKGKGEVFARDILAQYVESLKAQITLERKLKIVIDGGNGTAGPVAERIFREMGCEVICIYCQPDGNFPNHMPDPMVAENISDLKSKVIVYNADIGIAYDGDGDRVRFVDERGNELYGDEALALLARDVLWKKKGAKVLCDVTCSKMLIDDVKRHGGVPVVSRTGHTFIRRRMIEEMIPIAGEVSGHVYYYDVGFDDGIFASLKMVESLSGKMNKKLSDMRATLPVYFSTPSIKIPCDDNEKFSVIENLKKDFSKEYDVITIDGVRVEFDDGWGLVRASNTEPILSVRFEAKTQKRLSEIVDIFREKMAKQRVYFTLN